MIFNVHTHLNDDGQYEIYEELVNECFSNNVTHLLVIGYDIKSSKRAIEISEKYENVYAAVAVSPFDVEKDNSLEELEKLLTHKKVKAVGEIGLDYHYDDNPSKEVQRSYFEKQIILAGKYNKTILIHCRDAMQDTIEVLTKFKEHYKRGIMHCYNGSYESSVILEKLGFYFSFAGPLTYKNSKNLKEVLKKIPLERILVETDDPYLPPALFRGQRNRPSYVRYVVNEVALLKEKEVQEIEEITFQNSLKVLDL